MNHTKTTLAAAMLLASVQSMAEDVPAVVAPSEYTFVDSVKTGQPMTSFRLRYEYVDQDGNGAAPSANLPLKNANAFTLRSLIGWQTAPFHNFSIAAQLINVSKLDDDFNDKDRGYNQPGKTDYPVVADPDNTDINQLYLDWTGISNTKVRLGRQSLKLDNVRFIGNVEYRQVMQVYDGVSVENKSIPDTEIYLAHYERVKQITTKLRNGDLDIAHAVYRFTPSESLTAYGYFQGMKHNGQNITSTPTSTTITGTGFTDNSNRVLGLRLDGVHQINSDWKAIYTAEYAKQNDYKGGNAFIDAHYWKLGGGAGYGAWFARLDRELLSSNTVNGVAKYGFQTPFGTNHLFQGWADLFLITPKEGIKDTFITAGGKFMDVNLLAEYHWLDSDKDFRTGAGTVGNQYGKELDFSAAYAYNKQISGKVEYAQFHEVDCYVGSGACTNTNTSRKRDTEKVWLTMMYTF
jgi:hypothetical protein